MATQSDPPQLTTTGLANISNDPGISLFYDITPALPIDPHRPVLVLSNSLAATVGLWDEFVASFKSTHTIIRYDARFHGKSPLSNGDFDYAKGQTIEDLADDVIKLLDSLQVLGPVEAFIGLSIGAGVGVVLAARHASRFKRFIIVGTRSHGTPTDAERFQARIDAIKSLGVQAQAQESLERWFDADWIAANPARSAAIVDIAATTPVEGFVASVAALKSLDVRPYAREVSTRGDGKKLLFVVGEKDAPVVVDDTRQLAQAAGSEVVVVPGAGHIVNVQQPERFHELVRNYLQSSI
ncbi:hypothetical protein FDECE_3704 [Fusarium decemcellulare]|nr:hypothetical protein FDECE_3704 [Fusarium decemcellulare]